MNNVNIEIIKHRKLFKIVVINCLEISYDIEIASVACVFVCELISLPYHISVFTRD